MLIYQGSLNILGGILAELMWQGLGTSHLLLSSTLAVTTGVLTLLLIALRPQRLGARLASLVFCTNLIPVYGILWTSDAALSSQGRNWIPFEPHELSCLSIAILAPRNRMIGVLAILLFPALALLQYATFSAEEISRLPLRALSAPIAFASFALVLYFFRLRGLRIADFAAKKDAESQMMRKLTRTILAIKDLANSPMQTLTLDAEILRRKHSGDLPVANRIAKSVLQLRELNRILDERLRGAIDGSVETSFDPRAELKKTRHPGLPAGTSRQKHDGRL